MKASRLSPVHDRLAALAPCWGLIDGMAVAETVTPDDAARARVLALADLSYLRKAGFKGPQAATWLGGLGVPVPAEFNTWNELAGGGLIARLAVSEFFIEDAPGGGRAAELARAQPPAGVYPVLRQDAGFALAGARVHELLLQTCSFDFAGLGESDCSAVMTSMTGVSVLVVRQRRQPPCYRIWCDATFAPYLWDTLLEIAAELGGGPVGSTAIAAVQD